MTSTRTGSNDLRMGVIVGSVRKGRLGPDIAKWFAKQVVGFDVGIIDLDDFDLPLDMNSEANPGVARMLQDFGDADAFTIVTPEYNHSYPAVLKLALDLVGAELHSKPVGFVSYGGISGGLRAVEHLRPVLAELNATTIRHTVAIPNVFDAFDATKGIGDDVTRARAVVAMVSQLEWWARTLKNGRRVQPRVA